MIKTKQQLPKWFNGELYDKGDIVRNRLSGEKCKLNAMELSMYDFIIGSQLIWRMGIKPQEKHIKDFQNGLRWFIENNAKAYMILLD